MQFVLHEFIDLFPNMHAFIVYMGISEIKVGGPHFCVLKQAETISAEKAHIQILVIRWKDVY